VLGFSTDEIVVGLLVMTPAVFALAVLAGAILLLAARKKAASSTSANVMTVFAVIGITTAAGIGACYGFLLLS
jgi:hypothetical protein